MFCSKCGTKLEETVRQCPNCGAPVEVKSAPQQEANLPLSENSAGKTESGTAKFPKNKLFFVLLVLVLGAAVYLIWQFLGTNKLPAEEDTSSTVSQSGAAQLVNSTSAETASGKLESSFSEQGSADTISEARRSRDATMASLDEALKNADEDSEEKRKLVEQAADIAQDILKETNIEDYLQTKGYETVAYVDGENCSVVVAGKLEDTDMLIIQEAVMDQTGFSADKITITGTE